MQTWAIVVAAGSGARFGGAKQFREVDEERLVDRAAETAGRCCDGVVVVLPVGAEWDGPPVAATVAGGATRAASVRAGLAAVPESVEIVVVHDVARPLAGDGLFGAVIGAVAAGADGAVPGLPISDTIKRVDGEGAAEPSESAETSVIPGPEILGHVLATVARDDLVTVQTPQAFRAAVLRAAHADAGEGTDDAALVEAAGGTVVVVPGERSNLKVTGPEDLMLVTALLSLRSRS